MARKSNYVSAKIEGGLVLTDHKGKVRRFSKYHKTSENYPKNLSEWTYAVEGWYRRVFIDESTVQIIAEGSWSTEGNDYLSPSRDYHNQVQEYLQSIENLD
jgi:aromatic ring hydroxylase